MMKKKENGDTNDKKIMTKKINSTTATAPAEDEPNRLNAFHEWCVIAFAYVLFSLVVFHSMKMTNKIAEKFSEMFVFMYCLFCRGCVTFFDVCRLDDFLNDYIFSMRAHSSISRQTEMMKKTTSTSIAHSHLMLSSMRWMRRDRTSNRTQSNRQQTSCYTLKRR